MSCRDRSNCTACYEEMDGCHWCKDNKCHPYMSPWGAPSTIRRQKPECRLTHGIAVATLSSPMHGRVFNGRVLLASLRRHEIVRSMHCDSRCQRTKVPFLLISCLAGCHWCEHDQACHSYGSPYGCLTGLSCFKTTECIRQQPEWKGYGPLPPPVLPILALLLLCVALCACAQWANRNKVIEKDKNNVSGDRDDTSGENDIPGGVTFVPLALMPGEDEDPAESAEEGMSMITQETRPQGRSAWHCVGFCCCAFCLLFIALAMILHWLLSPHLPEVHVCNQMTNWDKLGAKLQNLGLAGDIDLLISVFNPNRVDALVRHVTAQFTWEGTPVGQWQLEEGNDVIAKGGAILDYELSVHFSPSVFTAVRMYNQYQNKSLVLDLALQITTDLTFAGITVGRHKEFEVQAPVDVFSPAVHSLCKCNL